LSTIAIVTAPLDSADNVLMRWHERPISSQNKAREQINADVSAVVEKKSRYANME